MQRVHAFRSRCQPHHTAEAKTYTQSGHPVERPLRGFQLRDDTGRWCAVAFYGNGGTKFRGSFHNLGASAKAEAAIQLVKERGGWPDDEITLPTARDQYQKWKEQDKSRSAKYSRSKRGKKKDERRGARSDKERKALLRDVEHKHGREGAKVFIEESFE